MSEGVLRVVEPGPLTTVQDLGRTGYQRFGVSVSGAVDAHALALGNRLVGNEPGAAGLEITLGGARFSFDGPAVLAVGGADLGATMNGMPVPMWETARAAMGDELHFGAPITGLRAYLCIAGGLSTPAQLGSRATHVASGLGGVGGRALRSGDLLPVGGPGAATPPGLRAPPQLIPPYGSNITVRVVPGPQDGAFTEAGLETFFSAEYSVTDRSDRQGARLDGPTIEAVDGRYDIVSDAVPVGSVQVPGDGKPIVLLADRQTTGGYAKIGVVAGADLPLLAQCGPGARIHFERVSVDDAQAATREIWAALLGASFEPPPGLLTYSLQIVGRHYQVGVPTFEAGVRPRLGVEINGRPLVVDVAPLDLDE